MCILCNVNSVSSVESVLQCSMQRLVRVVPVSTILESLEAFWLSLDLNGNEWSAGATTSLLNCPTHNWALPSTLPSGNQACNKQIFVLDFFFWNFLIGKLFGETLEVAFATCFIFTHLNNYGLTDLDYWRNQNNMHSLLDHNLNPKSQNPSKALNSNLRWFRDLA